MSSRAAPHSAELYRELAEIAPDPIIAIDIASTILSVNGAVERTFGYRPDELVGHSLLTLIPPRFRALHLAVMARYIETGVRHISWQRIEVPVLARSGDEIPVEITFAEFTSRTRGARTFVGFLRDVSDRVASERALVEANEMLHERAAEAEAANRAKAEFLTTMSHELRTPLNAIGGYADLLLLGLRGTLTPEQQEDIERIRRSGQHLLGLINDVLNFAKLEAGEVEFDIQETSVAAVLDSLEDLILPQVEAKELRYVQEKRASEVMVRVDSEKVRQIILNLLANAVKFTDAGGEITLTCDADARQVRIDVRDTGRGIPTGQLQRVFDPFVQVDRHLTSASQQGVGLGLAISRDLARAMGGDLTATSSVGAGSTFTLRLPRA